VNSKPTGKLLGVLLRSPKNQGKNFSLRSFRRVQVVHTSFINATSILIVVFLSTANLAADPLPPMAVSKRNLVVTCQPLAAKIGLDILKAGGMLPMPLLQRLLRNT
jgi:hypothetical protein